MEEDKKIPKKVRSLVLKFLPNIRLCVTPNTSEKCNINTPQDSN